MKITEMLISLFIASVLTIGTVLVLAYILHERSIHYVFSDDSTYTERHQLKLDRKGGYEITHWNLKNERIYSESGTYSETGGSEITLIDGDNRTYKIQIWAQDSKRPQYRLN